MSSTKTLNRLAYLIVVDTVAIVVVDAVVVKRTKAKKIHWFLLHKMNGGFPDALSSSPFIRSEYEERIHISIENI